MAIEKKVQVIRRETIKPSSPTPHHLSAFKLSLLDQLAPDMNVPLILFYPLNDSNGVLHGLDRLLTFAEKTQHLKKTLSQTLNKFYPFAGRITSRFASVIECNDDGVEFLEAKIDCSMSNIFEKPDIWLLKQLVGVAEPECQEAGVGHLLLVQATFFQCGGMAIGVSISHKVADAASLLTFLKSWCLHCCVENDHEYHPEFGVASLLPPIDLAIYSDPPIFKMFPGEKCITSRFVFEAKNIDALQRRSASETVKRPTRVEAVTALIWKSAMDAYMISSNKATSLRRRPRVFAQAANIRPRTANPLPENFVGNLMAGVSTMLNNNESTDLQVLVAKLRASLEDFKKYFAKELDVEEVKQAVEDICRIMKKDDEFEIFGCSSWCRFPFYDINFGWGKPAWATNSSLLVFKNSIVMMDTPDGGGIEVCLNLEEEAMALVESNQELLAFAALNPSVF
ncbi:hypothetical protein FNV43_RR01712 [Rhamnella rubrinervis]|uniref:BAHD acyltransferase n=1 Tax=Rhamnella rubrinervis TaxID=2594499 RepID=A0A8K0MTJ1_9ROSA|nr:hypothetical protein FNV43_RR01712 [Rhamnella rubrinervis]